MVIWKDVPVLIKHKFWYKRGLKKTLRYARANVKRNIKERRVENENLTSIKEN